MYKIFKKGFTLIEMVIVIIIIGVLLGALTNLTSSIKYSKITTTISQLEKLHKAVNDYMSFKKGYTSYSLLDSNVPNWNKQGQKNSIWELYFNNKVIKNGFSKKWSFSVVNGQLVISSNIDNSEDCDKIVKKIKNRVADAKCEGNTLKVYYNDGN